MNTVQRISAVSKEVQALLTSQMDMKTNGTLEASYTRSVTDRKNIQNHFNAIKDLHMTCYVATRDSKQATTEAKENMNEKQVELQDVMYEKRHILEKCVQCREFRSVYQDVELIPLDEFQAKAGPEYLQDSNNPHQLMINRLKYELVVRTALKEKQEELQAHRTQLIKENREAQKKVNYFDKLLDDFVQSTTPIDEALAEENKEPDAEVIEIVEDDDEMEQDNTQAMDTTL